MPVPADKKLVQLAQDVIQLVQHPVADGPKHRLLARLAQWMRRVTEQGRSRCLFSNRHTKRREESGRGRHECPRHISPLFARNVRERFFVLVADVFDQFGIEHDMQVAPGMPRARVDSGIVDGQVNIEAAVVRPANSLDGAA
jgi:hypothetical protein